MTKKAIKEKKIKSTPSVETGVVIAAGGKDPGCPQGYSWNGTKCIKDVG